MTYLCIETSTENGFIALFSSERKELEYEWSKSNHSDQIIQALKKALLFIDSKKIQFIAVNQGPGRFTGIRVGINFSKVIAYFLNIPIYPLSSLRLKAEPYLLKQSTIACLMQAFGDQFFLGCYQKFKNKIHPLIKPCALSLKELEQEIEKKKLEPTLCISDIYKEENLHHFPKPIQKILKPVKNSKITALDFSHVILSDYKKENLKNWKEVEPLYLRTPGVLKSFQKK